MNTIEAQYEQLIKMFETNRDQGAAFRNTIKDQEAEILKLKGNKFTRVNVTFVNQDGAEAVLFFDRPMNPTSFDMLYKFVLGLREDTVTATTAHLNNLATQLQNYLSAARSPQQPPEDDRDGPDDEDDEPVDPPNNGSDKKPEAKTDTKPPAKIPEKIEKRGGVDEAVTAGKDGA